MKTEDKVCSLEWAKKVQEAGIFVETEFSYSRRVDLDGYQFSLVPSRHISERTTDYELEVYAAPLPCELMDVLSKHEISVVQEEEGIEATYWGTNNSDCHVAEDKKNPADALAQLAIWLKENNLI